MFRIKYSPEIIRRTVDQMVSDMKALVVRAVNVNWNSDNREWNCNCNDLDNWNGGNEVLSRNKIFSPPLSAGEFLFEGLSSTRRLSCLPHSVFLKVPHTFHLARICSPRLFAGRILFHRVWIWHNLT